MSNDRTIPSSKVPDTVTRTIKINGNAIDRKYQIDAVSIIAEINRIPLAKLVLIDGNPAKEDFEVSNEDLFVPGNELEILTGYHSDETSLFKGIIIKHSIKIRGNGNSVLVLDCRDPAIKMTIGRHSKYYYDATDKDIIESLVQSYGLEFEMEDAETTFPEVVQYDATDWDFMLSRVDMNAMICLTDGGKITIQTPVIEQDPALKLTFGATIRELDAEIDARTQVGAVSSYAWDYTEQELLEIEAEDPAVNLNGNLKSSELAGVVGPEKWELRHSGKISDAELQSWANARLFRSQLAKVRGRVKFQGFPDLKPGMIIELNGLGERFNGKAFVSAVSHQISGGDWQTEAQFGLNPEWFAKTYDVSCKPAANMLPAIHGVQIGIVSKLGDDPDGEDRIQVRLPVIDPEEEGVWARLACLDAGEERGVFFRPEIDDEVIVGFINDDPRHPVVLGMLHSSTKPAPNTATDENHEKGIVTRSKMKIIFDDDKKSLNIETPAGKKITIDEDAGVIQLEDENANKFVLDSSGILLESSGDITLKATGDIKMESANIDAKASATYKADGGQSIELTSSATAVLKGAMVQIN